MKFLRVLRISRPRFWIYELGPYMIGVLAAYIVISNRFDYIEAPMAGLLGGNWFIIVLFALYFLIPANILIYGVNDIYDYETDKLNPKKVEGYEALVLPSEQPSLWKRIACTTIPFIFAVSLQFSWELIVGLVFHTLFCIYYSAEPIRAKARPVRDCIFSASLYTLPAVIGYIIASGGVIGINWGYILAGWMWCVAMQIYSAVPDIAADIEAGLATTATMLGGNYSIVTCMIFYALASMLSYPALGIVSWILGAVYFIMMIWTRVRLRDISQIYRYFPWVNMISGMCIFLVLLYSLIYG